ncbi:MAG: hypothetical protein P1U42_12415 [Phycisphaerales bacterium]|nr:hypothetical protein [Phycisphaerales bacterium]
MSKTYQENELGFAISDDGIIPFADEVAITRNKRVEQNDTNGANTEPLSESAVEEFGSVSESVTQSVPQRVSVVDRDLGINQDSGSNEGSGKKSNKYSCPCCGQGARRVMRVRVNHQSQPKWVAVCALCAASMLARIPGTIVGGMVRPSRKRMRRTQTERKIAQGQMRGFRAGAQTGYRRAS